MPPKSSDRSAHFPLIEKKHGKPMSHWFALLKKNSTMKYAEQVALLKDGHGFSQAHANALVMYCKGSTSSKRFATFEDYLANVDATQAKTIKAVFAAIRKKYPKLEIVIAWNQPMLKSGDQYVFGLSTTKTYILLAPWSKNAVSVLAKDLRDYTTNKKTIAVPSDWKVDATLLHKFVKARLDEISGR